MQAALSQTDAVKYRGYADLLDAIRLLRKKTIVEAFFWLEVPRYPAAPIFGPDAKGEAFFVLPVARIFTKQPQPKELEQELASFGRSSRFVPSYDSKLRRLTFYPPEAVADVRRSLAPWLITPAEFAKFPFLQFADEVVIARIPKDREAEFLDALITGFFRSSRKEFKCAVGWN